jgi:hypothetical protein
MIHKINYQLAHYISMTSQKTKLYSLHLLKISPSSSLHFLIFFNTSYTYICSSNIPYPGILIPSSLHTPSKGPKLETQLSPSAQKKNGPSSMSVHRSPSKLTHIFLSSSQTWLPSNLQTHRPSKQSRPASSLQAEGSS